MAGWSAFCGDVAEATRIWARAPLAPAVAMVVGLAIWGLGSLGEGGTWLGLLASLATVGLFGAQRLAFQRAVEGRPASLQLIIAASGHYGARFLALGVLVGMAGLALGFVALLVATGGANGGAPILGVLLMLGLVLLIDVLLTFVTPALTFTTADVGTAWAAGRRMLRETWAETKFHALLPPIAVLAVGQAVSAGDAAGGFVIAIAGTALGIVARGAHTLAYLRHNEVSWGAVPPSIAPDYRRR